MKNTDILKRVLLAGGAAIALSVTLAAAEMEPLGSYYDNTLIWQNQTTKAIGRIWLNRDGKYYAFYDMGVQPVPPTANGPYRVQGREGTWTLRNGSAPYQLCLWPRAPRINIGAAVQKELYAEGACYSFTPHAVGETWTENGDTTGRPYKFWFVKGR